MNYLELLSRVPVEKLQGRAADELPAPGGGVAAVVEAAEDADPVGLTSQVLRVVAALSPDGVLPPHAR